eukprot:m.102100 g.102100  ORF g.102100 m.102100 type:complete len:51 (-) comp13218_c0_seq4:1953-2105(-)
MVNLVVSASRSQLRVAIDQTFKQTCEPSLCLVLCMLRSSHCSVAVDMSLL